MKKVGIVTIVDNNNYGNRLQNYAVQEILKKNDGQSVTLLNNNYTNDRKFFLLKILKRKLFYKNKKKINNNRKNNFEEFNKNIVFSKKRVYPFSKLKNYDFFVTGSDQVWNPKMGRMKDVDLLSFAPKNKRISLSASFGVSDLEQQHYKKLKKELEKFKAISVREEAGKKIINKIIEDKEVEVLIDPTMMLDEDDWEKVIKKPKMLDTKKYILNYFLGGLSESNKNKINEIALKSNCEVIDILDPESKYNECGPSEFLYLEKNAFLVCTDSFHSSVFAILFNRPFIVFDREGKGISMNSRLDTLLTKFNLLDRKYNGKDITEENIQHNYDQAYIILKKEREKSNNFIKKSLDIMEKD